MPLCFSHFILSLSFCFNKFVNKFLISSLVVFTLFVILLKFNDFLPSLLFFCLFNFNQCCLVFESSIKELLITLFFLSNLNSSEFFLCCIMSNQLQISFSVQNEFLSLLLLISFSFLGPLSFKHMLLAKSLIFLRGGSLSSCVSLPGQDIDSFLNLGSFVLSFSLFSLNFLLLIKHPQLSINLLFDN